MILAKSNPKESLAEHTRELLKRYEELYDAYGQTIKDQKVWDLLRFAALYHDTGKAYSQFQYTIKRALGEEVEPTDYPYIPHGYLSPFFLPLKSLNLDKKLRKILIEAIAYHHERDVSINAELLLKIAREDLIHRFGQVGEELAIETPEDDKFFPKIANDLKKERIKSINMDQDYLTYVLVKGLLHRLDHAASAHVAIEIDPHFDLSRLTQKYLKQLTGRSEDFLRPLQKFALENQDKNLILTAQTGMGKTEAALLWAGRKKTFFTVPLRVSLNALYDRVSTDMDYKNCGLLHSTSAHHLDEKGEENWEVIFDQSKHFSNKLIFTTIDQILKFPFKFRGYEKYYATLAHSCVVIDEIQAYSPWIVAVVLKAIEMIHKIGGKFMIMTATLPRIYLEALKERNIIDGNCEIATFYDDSILRHRIEMKENAILDGIGQMVESAKEKKVLAIVNTIDRAVELYRKFKEHEAEVYLLHARFLQKDRQLLERHLRAFDQDRDRKGIWITTQIVEASIDIDFDELHTELAPLDSLFQRFGRCYRKRELQHDRPNIFIYAGDVSGNGPVYDKEIMKLSKEFLQRQMDQYGAELLESQKIRMVDTLYSKSTLAGTKFLESFQKAMNELDYMEDYQITSEEAQKILRGENSVTVIPRQVYDSILPIIERLETEPDQRKRTEIRREIERYTCSVNLRTFQKDLQPLDHYRQTANRKYPLFKNVYILERNYDFNEKQLMGVGIVKEDSSWGEII